MNILVVGLGRVGLLLVETLDKQGHDLAVLDDSPAQLAELNDRMPNFHGAVTLGAPIDVDILRTAGVEGCDAVIAATNSDNINIMVAQIADKVFHIDNVIARITDPFAKEVFSQRFGLRAICGTNLTAQAIITGLMEHQDDAAQEVRMSLGSSTVNFSTVPITPEQCNKPLAQIALPRTGMARFGVLRASGVMELETDKGLVLRNGDQIVYAEQAD